MEKFNNIYMYASCVEGKHMPKEIEKMYENQYGQGTKKRFCRTIKRQSN